MLKNKREIMIAGVLLACLMTAALLCGLVTNYVGKPVNLGGEIKNIRVKITEICSRNRSIICDENGVYSDYIELYNDGEQFDLQGFLLTDNKNSSVRYKFESRTFQHGEYLVVFLDGKNVPFSLKSGGGEWVYFLSPDGAVIDAVETVATESNYVYALQDGSFVVTADASPGFPNTAEGVQAFRNSLSSNAGPLVINEVLLANKSVLPDKSGNFSDIVEIANISDKEVSSDGWFLSDDKDDPHKFALPDIKLKPGEFLLVFADGKGTYEDGEVHASFGYSSGEPVVLSDRSGKYSSVESIDTENNISYCRTVDGNGTVTYQTMRPSLGFANTDEGINAFIESRTEKNPAIIISEVMLSVDEMAYKGAVCDVIELTNISDGAVSTKGWCLSDDSGNAMKYPLPERVLQPGECMVVIADGRDMVNGGEIHANFSVAEGESIILSTAEKKQCEPFKAISAGRGNSWQYSRDSEGGGFIAGSPSIGFSNDDQGRKEYAKSVRPSGIEISEAVSVNKKYIPGPYGTYHDFIELHNNSDTDVSLKGMYLSDDSKKLTLAPLPDMVVKAGGYVTFILSTEYSNIPSGYSVLPFSLSSEGETVYLSKDNIIIDCISIPALTANTAYGRASGSDEFSILASATPNAANAAAAKQSPQPTASVPQGVYNNVESLRVELNGKGVIRYTFDCTEPTEASQVYTGPIELRKTTVIRARCFEEGYAPGKVLDLIYVINEGHSLDVVSIITNPDNLWDYYTGIYVEGPNASPEFPHVGANYWQQWEKAATVSFFANDGTGFSLPCGIRIFGAYSRALDMKSFTCFFRAIYGAKELDYKLFGDEGISTYEAFVLRNSGQDFKRARMRDELITSLAADYTTLDVQKYRPAVLYLNGEFWGVYYIKEKINENFIAGNHNVPEDSVILARANGTVSDEYQDLVKYARTHDLSNEEYYQYVIDRIDKENYIDYICAEIYIANQDNGNIRFYKSNAMDGKWRWILFDVDQSFASASHPTVAEHLNPAGTGAYDMFSTALINALLKNRSFKEEFLRRLAWQMNTIWTEENVRGRINELKGLIEHDMQRDFEKWNWSKSTWESHINTLIYFQKNRYAQLYKQIKSYFSLTDEQMAEYGYKQ